MFVSGGKFIYNIQYETEPYKYAKGNYGGENSPAYFGGKKKQKNLSRNYKNHEQQIKSCFLNNFHLHISIAQKFIKSIKIGRIWQAKSPTIFP